MTEQELCALIRQEPGQGLAVAIERYGGLVKAVLYRMLGSRPQDIEDCMGTVFCRLWQNAGMLESEKGGIKPWLCRVARNAAIDLLRREGEPLLSLEEQQLGQQDDLTEEAERRFNAGLVQRTVDAMEEPDRTIFIRRYFYLERVRHIAAALGLSEKAVERRLARGRERLRGELLEKGVIWP